MDAFWQKIDRMVREALSGDAAQSGRPEAAAQAAADGATGEGLGACPSNTPPSSSQITLPGFPEYKSTFGIDWLEWGGVTEWPAAEFEKVMGQLEAAKLRCQEREQDEVRILLNDTEPVYVQRLGMKRGKSGGVYFHYRFLYKGIAICLARRSGGLGDSNVFVALRGTDCLFHGAIEAYATVNGLLSRLGAGPVQEEKISRVDLRLDITGLPVGLFKNLIDNRHFISRVRMIRAWENKANGAFTGVTIGNRPRLLRIYDKLEEQRPKYNAEIHQALVDRCFGGVNPEHATRVEYQLGRTYLKRYGIHSVADLLSMLGSLLKQLTTEYFRFTCEPVVSADKHQSRAEVHPLWVAIQSAFLEHAQVPAQKLVPIRYEHVHPHKLIAQGIGCFASAMLQRKLVFATFEEFVHLFVLLIREHFREGRLRDKFLKRYWERFKDKPGDYPHAA